MAGNSRPLHGGRGSGEESDDKPSDGSNPQGGGHGGGNGTNGNPSDGKR